MTPKPKRGGYQEPLQSLTITIPNYAKHNPPMKKGRRIWVRFERSTPNDARVMRLSWEHRGIFFALVMICDEGVLADVTYRDIGKMIDARPQTVENAVKKLAAVGLIQTTYKRPTNDLQTTHERPANDLQTPSDTQAFEQSANDAAYSALQTDNTDREGTEKTTSDKGGEPAGDFSQPPATVEPAGKTVTAADLIEQALAAAQVPHRGADPILFYRSEAVGFMTRRPGDMRNEVWASWVCQAIAAVGDCDDWQVRVNAALKKSATVGSFIPPEAPRPKNQRGGKRQMSEADRAYFASLNDEFGTVPSHG